VLLVELLAARVTGPGPLELVGALTNHLLEATARWLPRFN
jgi:hypothetical protein